jgi:putative lipoic acid-binding regulatory protein
MVCGTAPQRHPGSPMAEQDSPIHYPTDFPIKIVGLNQAGFETAISEVLRNHAPDFDVTSIEVRESRAGKYLSLTATINAKSRDQLDELYRALTAHPMVRVVL